MSEFPLYPNNCHHDEMPERCWRCLESELAEARARIAELEFTHGHTVRDLARIAELETQLRDTNRAVQRQAHVERLQADRIAELNEKTLAAQASQREALQACAELEREIEALQSRNAAEKAAATLTREDWLVLRRAVGGASLDSLFHHAVAILEYIEPPAPDSAEGESGHDS